MAAAKFLLRLLPKKPKRRKMSELNPMSRRPVIRNSVLVNARLAAIAALVNRANHGRQGNLVNHAAATGLPAAWIAAIVDRATVDRAIMIAAANAAVAATVEIVGNVLRCANAPRWIVATVDRAMTVADAAVTVTVDRVIVIVTVADVAMIAADRAITIVPARATVVPVTTIVRAAAAAATATTIVRRNVAAVTATSAIATAITLRAVNRCATILRVAEAAVLEAAN